MLELRRSLGDRLMVGFFCGFLFLFTGVMIVAAVAIGTASLPLGVFVGALAALMVFLCVILWRETAARWKTRIRLDPTGLRLVLPGARGFVKLPAVDTLVPWDTIKEVDTREEAFRSIGTTSIQRAYALSLADGSRIELGADRPMMAPFFERAAQEIAAWSGAPLREMGLYDGKAGLALVAANSAPSWSAAPVSEATAQKRRRAAQFTLWLVGAMVMLAMLARALSYMGQH